MSDVVCGPPPKRSRNSKEAMPWQGAPNLAGIRARDQVAALLLATRPRGRKAGVALAAPVVRLLWDEWVMGCVRWLAVDVRVSRSPPGHPLKRSCVFEIGISMLLLGITHELTVRESLNYEWRLGGGRGLGWNYHELFLRDELMGVDTLVFTEKADDLMYLSDRDKWFCANSKWFMACCGGKHAKESRIVLGSLPTQRDDAVADHVFPFPPGMASCFVCFNKFVENEAFIVLRDTSSKKSHKYDLTLWIIDADASCSTKILSMSSIKLMCRSCKGSKIRDLLPMRKSNGQAIFIASSAHLGMPLRALALDTNDSQEETVTSVLDRRARGVSQLSESLFCVLHTTKVLIWDCNNLHNAISSIQVPKMQHFMIGLGFFLKVSDDRKKIHVIEASASLDMKTVATVEFLLPGCSFSAFEPGYSSRIW
ncbi:hypothetical protein Pelo_10387 [Pelomyxa schiedti]|nr:hypothetical protein Pelo_10387 [Pelomyxa schiedti]